MLPDHQREGSTGRREWLLLALDWRASAAGFDWARGVLKRHPKTPAILTTHELVHSGGRGGEAAFSSYGERLWDELPARPAR